MKRPSEKILFLLAAAVAFFFIYSFLNLAAPLKFNSPDENSNYFFTGTFAESGRLWSFESLNLVTPGMVHPRSVRVVDNFLVPGGFVGLPVIFGAVAKAVGMDAVPYLTPLVAVLAALVFASLAGKFFGRETGLAAGLLLLANPVWWYEASRPLMPNTLFVALLIFAAWFLLAAPFLAARADKPRRRWDFFWRADGAIAGVLFGLALAVRLSEIYWLALAAVLLAAVSLRRLPWSRLALFLIFAAVTLLPFVGLNKALYGSWTGTGYGPGLGGVPLDDLPAGMGAKLLGGLQPYLFPLGFAPRTAWQNFLTYGIRFFWWWSALAAAALAALAAAAYRLRRRHAAVPRAAAIFAAVAGLVSVWLIIFYGSWTIHDNPDPRAVTIGTSYLRYWLPVFVLSTVPVAWALTAAAARLPVRFRAAAVPLFFVGLAAVSGFSVFGAKEEGLLAIRGNLIRYDREVSQVMASTESNALIVVDRADKLLFPDRRVIYPLRSDATFEALGLLAGRAPLYYYGITFPEKDLRYLREEKLPPLGLTIDLVATFQEESLYALRLLPQPPRT